MDKQLSRIANAYDLTVDQYNKGIGPFEGVPNEFKNSQEFKTFMDNSGVSCNSSATENKEFLSPEAGMNFLDAGCCANLANYHLHQWPSVYYGVDISPAIIKSMKQFVAHESILIGGLYVSDILKLPFDDDFFDIASVIGVFEYYDLEYVSKALKELNRVLKPQARVIVDVPSLEHEDVNTMFKLEEYLGRPNIPKSRTEFEFLLKKFFSIEIVDDFNVMLKYFVRNAK